MIWWPEPTAGDIVWCRFPPHESIPGTIKARPTLIIRAIPLEPQDRRCWVVVAYGTSQKTSRIYRDEFLISKFKHPEAYRAAGLSRDTKFCFSKVAKLPFNDIFFAPPPHAPYGETPKLGSLHPIMMSDARAAFGAKKEGTH
jgi:hypothetical protein